MQGPGRLEGEMPSFLALLAADLMQRSATMTVLAHASSA